MFEYTDPDGDRLTALPITHCGQHGPAVSLILRRAETGVSVGQFIPADRVEEVIAGIRDTARTASGQPTCPGRTLTPLEHDRAWHAIEGATGAEDADPGTVLAAVLRALNIAAPSAEDKMAAVLGNRPTARRQQPEPVLCLNCEHPMADHDEDVCGLPSVMADGTPYKCGCTWGDDDQRLEADEPAPAVGHLAEARTADRAAVLREAADAFERDGYVTQYFGHQVAAELRRMAEEARS
ncbi:hypothetical protein R1T08_17190 [Streptomyces sp. SBC-4]|nr:hypothetical protein [Streptomyces sp. SBC-4]MDV5145896.1 hypothetical protein [Streptomyces sp. SBC-4]